MLLGGTTFVGLLNEGGGAGVDLTGGGAGVDLTVGGDGADAGDLFTERKAI